MGHINIYILKLPICTLGFNEKKRGKSQRPQKIVKENYVFKKQNFFQGLSHVVGLMIGL